MGTPDYIAPEQIRGEELTPQADQYSLGLVLFETLTGVSPLFGRVHRDPLPQAPDRAAPLWFLLFVLT